ncbi:hypothetical protein SteCoe_5985 [Stentor coeruleus]|uniref:PB1 domain-containing protein n=1 Tax=Stentor coeruleus TaxID=5963 RepID=A0A1R2CR58_9CILI|nr:hypothetical protein SteCoe_5985 [Stentor coeruleus]
MENKKLKLLFSGKKGILLQRLPDSIESLHKIIESYYTVDSTKVQITFKDKEKDECEVLDNITYIAACGEFESKVVFSISVFNSVPISRLTIAKVPEGRKTLKFFKKKTRKMAIFDIETETTQWVTFPVGISFKEYAAWVELPSGEILYCGGGHPTSSKEAYLLNPYTQTYKSLPGMIHPRHSHGIAYNNGCVYIVGGMRNMLFFGSMMKECEKFVIETSTWQALDDLETPRGDSAAVVVGEKVFAMGKGSQYLTGLDTQNSKIDLKEDEGGCMATIEDLIYVIQGQKIKVCSITDLRVVEEITLPRKESWWSHCPPVCHEDSIYFVWWEEPGWICKFNRRTKEFKKLTSLFV